MKFKWNKNSAIAVLFICFIFLIMAGTAAKALMSMDEYKTIYSGILGESSGIAAKAEAVMKTAYSATQTIDSKVFKRTDFINLYGLIQKAAGTRYVYDSADKSKNIVKLDDGAITFTIGKEHDYSKKAAQKITNFKTRLADEGIDLLFVQLPYKIDKLDKQLPVGVEDYSNEIADGLVKSLKSQGVDTLDIRDEIYKDGLDYSSIFFRTDHHWKPQTGLWATNKICENLNINYGFRIDLSLLNINNFNSTVYKNCFLGSEGKRVGQFYAGTDDFTLLLPKYKTDMSNIIYHKNGKEERRNGSFEDSMIFHDQLGSIDYFGKNTYAAYSGGDYPLSININNKIADKKILVIRDSFSCTITPFMSLAACRELHIIDPRYYKESVKDYIDKTKPDIVLVICNPSNINSGFFVF